MEFVHVQVVWGMGRTWRGTRWWAARVQVIQEGTCNLEASITFKIYRERLAWNLESSI